jgi:uncharacterized protein (TIGR02996 family)
MRDEATFLSAIATGDDVARLGFADWLEERGDRRAVWVRDPDVFPWMLPDGRDPTEALVAAAIDADHPQQYKAQVALPKLGAVAIPRLLQIIAAGDFSYWAGEAIGAMSREAVEPFLPDILELLRREEQDVCIPALEALRGLGPAAAPALPRLIEMLPAEDEEDDWEFEEDGDVLAEIIGSMGPVALPAVPGLIRLGNFCHEEESDDALVAIGPAVVPDILETVRRYDNDGPTYGSYSPLRRLAPEALPALRSALRDDSPAVRRAAAVALAGHDAQAAMPVLLASLEETAGQEQHRDSRLADAVDEASAVIRPSVDVLERLLPALNYSARSTIAALLQRLGQADGALRVLLGMLSDADAERRAGAVIALGNLDGLSDDVYAAIVPLLDDPATEVRDAVRNRLSGHDVAFRAPVVPALLAAVRSTHLDTSTWALTLHADYQSPEGLAVVVGGLSDLRPEVRKHAVELLRGREGVTTGLIRAARDREADVRAAAVWALAVTGTRAEVTPSIQAALGDKAAGVLVAGLRAAVVRGPGYADEAKRALQSRSTSVREAALDLICLCGMPDAEAVALLRERLSRERKLVGVVAHRLADLAERGVAEVAEAVPGLVKHLDGAEGEAACRALLAIGAPAVAELARALRGKNALKRREAARALAGEHGAGAITELIAALRSDDDSLREEAAKALVLCATPSTPTAPLVRLLTGQNANTTEYALSALARIGRGGASWSDAAHLLDHSTDDVAACAVWAAGCLLLPEQAREEWRGMLSSPRDCIRRAAHLQLHRAGLMDAPSSKDLLEAAIVFALRPGIVDMLATRAAADQSEFNEIRGATTWSHHGKHGAAVAVMGRVGHLHPREAVYSIVSGASFCSERGWHQTILRALWSPAPLAPDEARSFVRSLCEGDDPASRGLALALMRRLVPDAGEVSHA